MSTSSNSGSSRRGGPPRAFDPTMKARKAQLFDEEEPEVPWSALEERKPFRQHLLETKGAPLSTGMKVLLWSMAAVVALLFCAATYKITQPPKPKKPPATRTQHVPIAGPSAVRS